MSRPVRILVVDDSVVARRVIADILGEERDFDVVGTAANGRIALAKIPLLSPDVITLDVDMPELNGLEVLAVVRAEHPSVRVVMVSSLTERGAKITVDSLVLGASDYVTKAARASSAEEARGYLRGQLVPKIRALAPVSESRKAVPAPRPVARPAPAAAPGRTPRPVELVAIGASTGGPNALVDVLQSLPATFPTPIVIVQHMPEGFTAYLARRLDSKCAIRVVEGGDGLRLEAGCAYVAPGNRHMEVVNGPEGLTLATHQGPMENSCRPSVDVLLRSVERCVGAATLCVVLTGMGQDGLRGCEGVRAAGGQIVVQDQATSVVWGMPGHIAEAGLADAILPVHDIAAEVILRTARPRS